MYVVRNTLSKSNPVVASRAVPERIVISTEAGVISVTIPTLDGCKTAITGTVDELRDLAVKLGMAVSE